MKVETVCRPPPTPSAKRTLRNSGTPSEASSSPNPVTITPPTKMSKKSMKAAPAFCVKRNIRYMMKRKIGSPSQRLRTMRSIFSESVAPVRASCLTAFSAMRSTKS